MGQEKSSTLLLYNVIVSISIPAIMHKETPRKQPLPGFWRVFFVSHSTRHSLLKQKHSSLVTVLHNTA